MKSLRYLFLAMLLTSLSVMAQDKPEKAEKAAKPEKVKAEKLYIIHEKSNKVTRVDVRKDEKGASNVIQIDVSNASGGANLATRAASLPPAQVTGVNTIMGTYNQTREFASTSRGMSIQLLDVAFPYRGRVQIGDQYVDFEIKEAGFWKISAGLTN